MAGGPRSGEIPRRCRLAALYVGLVLYQPPLDTLLEFAEYGGAVRRTPEYKREGQGSLDPKLVDPLIHELQHPYAVEGACRHYYETLLEEIGERYLKPRATPA